MEIKIKFYGLGYDDICQANVSIYDGYNLVYNGTTYNNELEICLKECKKYKLVATSCGETIIRYFYVSEMYEYIFFFSRSILKTNGPITFILTDYYYDNLPIERGNIILWQR